mmetsp:Transcript_34063/g.52342  ORF Transcript_34063/g.52342 Transcript_34063/m.52342 type:complete len:164 (+) Transcript_34063:1146-1637(+)
MKRFSKNQCILSDVKNRIKTRFAETFIRHPLMSKVKAATDQDKLKELRVDEIRPSLRKRWLFQEVGQSMESPNSCQLPKVSFSKEEVARYLADDQHSSTINPKGSGLRDRPSFEISHPYSERGRRRKSSKSPRGSLHKVEEEEPISIDEQMVGIMSKQGPIIF